MNLHRHLTMRIVTTAFGMFILIVLILASALLFTSKVRGDDPPFAPLNDDVTSATVISAQATTDAAEQADQDVMATAQAATSSNTTKDFYPTITPEAPDSVEAQEAKSIPVPTGISVPQALEGGWNSRYRITNMWLGTVDGNTVAVTAGSKDDDPGSATSSSIEQGLVIVSDDGDKEFLTPTKNGQIKITAASGTCLTLQTTTNGIGGGVTTYYFDVATQDWSCTVTP